jgi:N-methylhydantoinase A/oxoprolinase/acetone carboxylase beta subunit/N-methylhydantoinase B/oxoprolinase/acetone carboxylase alpha subunit
MYSVGVDVGGTFTDCVCLMPDGVPITAKVPTTPADPSRGVIAGVEALAATVGLPVEAFLQETDRFVHGTTVGTNALVERRGTPTAILTSRGHEDTFIVGKVFQKRVGVSERDMVHMSRLEFADPPLVARERIRGVAERVDYKGAVVCPLDEDDVRRAGAEMVAAGVRAVAVCFLWSFMNPEHERRAAELLREVDSELFVVCSHDVAPVLGEYERLTTTVLSAYLGPPMNAYLGALEGALRARGYRHALLVMQASGGLVPVAETRRNPVTALDSGPVGGIMGAVFLGGLTGREKLICTDVGGTTFDVGIVDGGRPQIESTPIVDKYQFRSTKVQVTSIGSGGGSVAWVDDTGVLKVGPRSAGADPGPACYGRGGVEATVTDADLVLGYLDPDNFLGGGMRLDRGAAAAALDVVAERLGVTRVEAADGIRRILDSQMADLVRRTTIERGYDPRDFTLLAYGGMGPTHAARYASDLGVAEVVVPADATAFSALGMLAAPLLRVYETSAPLRSPLGRDEAAAVTRVFAELEARALSAFAAEEVPEEDVDLRRVVLVRFQMQVHELEVDVPGGELAVAELERLEQDFIAAYTDRYGQGSAYAEAGLELVSYRVEARARADALELRAAADAPVALPRATRQAWFPEVGDYVETAIYPADTLAAGMLISGPAILERMGDTVVLPPGTTATADALGNLRLELAAVRAGELPAAGDLDPITYEVVKNRLWAINDEQAMTAAKISGTPLIYESFDFNSGILDAEGRGVFAGVYVTYHTTGLDLAVEGVMKTFGGRGDIHEGDVFVTNDPWVGAIHPSDVVVIAPIHDDGEIVAWTAIVMHDADVGGPVPGSFVVGATEVFGECPIFPPLRLMHRGEYCQEVEDVFLRNSRTPALNALNMRARLACQSVARARLQELIARYGIEVVRQVFRRIHDEVHTIVSRRLDEIPDGTWHEHSYLDHDGNDPLLYEAHLSLIKKGGRLTFDFTGTSPQAPGMINGTTSALRGGVMAALLPMVCYDVPWATGGLEQIVEIIAEPGTLNNASHPAGVSGGSVFGEAITENLVSSCLGKMLASSDRYRDEAMATWYPYANVQIVAGLDQFGREMAAVLLDCAAGGAGAKSFRDGIDCGGWLESVSIAMPNVESNERHYPVLEVYRRRRADTSGHGRFRGGVGMEIMLIPHDARGPIHDIVISSSVSQPEAPGIFGALPASVQGNVVLRRSDVAAQLAAGRVPLSRDEIERESDHVLEAKDTTQLDTGDAHVAWYSGGGGYGDPLRRDPELVLRDVRQGLCSEDAARTIYGVVLDEAGVADGATASARDEIRAERLARARPVADLVAEVGVR